MPQPKLQTEMLKCLLTRSNSIQSVDFTSRLLTAPTLQSFQSRGRRRTLTPTPWLPPKLDSVNNKQNNLNIKTRKFMKEISQLEIATTSNAPQEINESVYRFGKLSEGTRRVGLVVRKIGMMPQWTTNGTRLLCTLLEVEQNNVVNITSPESWYKSSVIGKRKAFNRHGAMFRVTVGAGDVDPSKFTLNYRRKFTATGVHPKEYLGCFSVTSDAIPAPGQHLDVRHFQVGQFVTATGKTIDWGFQGGMHRWGMRGQPTRRTTKSHRRIGSVGSVGDARIWPGKRMPGHMGYEWRTISGLEVVRINIDKQVIFVKGSVPGEVGDVLLLKDCLQPEKRAERVPFPTWSPSLETIAEEPEESVDNSVPMKLAFNEQFSPQLFQFTSPSILFTDADAKKAAGRDKTKAKIAKVKK